MSDILKAVGDVRVMARQAVALAQVVAVLDKLGPLEQAEAEAKLRADKARKDAEDAAVDLIAAKAQVKKAKDEAARIAEGAKTEADRIVASAKLTVEDILREADAKAKELIAGAKQAQAGADAAIAAAQAVLATLDDQIAAKEKSLSQIEASIAKLRTKLEA